MALGLNYFNTLMWSDYYNVNPASAGNEFAPAAKGIQFDPNTGLETDLGAADAEIEEPA